MEKNCNLSLPLLISDVNNAETVRFILNTTTIREVIGAQNTRNRRLRHLARKRRTTSATVQPRSGGGRCRDLVDEFACYVYIAGRGDGRGGAAQMTNLIETRK